MNIKLVPLDKWLTANTNLFVISLNKKTRKYTQRLISLDSETAIPINTSADFLTNAQLLLTMSTKEVTDLFCKKLEGHENYVYALKVFENTTGDVRLPLKALFAELVITHYKNSRRLDLSQKYGFILTQCVTNPEQAALPMHVLEEPNIHKDVIANQRSVHALLHHYCNMNDSVLSTPH